MIERMEELSGYDDGDVGLGMPRIGVIKELMLNKLPELIGTILAKLSVETETGTEEGVVRLDDGLRRRAEEFIRSNSEKDEERQHSITMLLSNSKWANVVRA